MPSIARKTRSRDIMLTDDQVRQRLAALDKFKKEGAHFGTWDMVVSVSGGLHGEMNDWPAHIREPILQQIEEQCVPRPGHFVKVVASGCFQDVSYEPCYIRVIVQEFPPIVRM